MKRNELQKLRPSDLWRWDGEMDRLPYLIWGSSLVTLKFFLDYLIAGTIFHHTWSWLNYIFPGQALDMLALSNADKIFYCTMIAFSLPFIWPGVVMTSRRLRAAGLPVWLVKLFFVPVVNLILFAVLCMWPTNKEEDALGKHEDALIKDHLETIKTQKEEVAKRKAVNFPIPKSKQARAYELVLEGQSSDKSFRFSDGLFSLVCTVPAGAFLVFFGAAILKSYGWGLFIGVPFAVGMSTAYLYGRSVPRRLGESIGIASLALTLLGVGVLLWAWEGVICLLMAAPIAFALAIMGAALGYHLQKKKHLSNSPLITMLSLLLILPFTMAAEYCEGVKSPLCSVSSSIDIAVPPEKVWPNIIAFPELAPPKEPLFHTGIAYPTGATINGAGVGAVRRCKFSTGTFVEPITAWKAPTLLQFRVLVQPEPMNELSVREIHPAHLDGYLKVTKGEFRLSPIHSSNGQVTTRLIGTTWYHTDMWPASYWRLWVDYLVHAIHVRVLEHIKEVSEST